MSSCLSRKMEICISWHLSWRVVSSYIINDQIVENMFFSSDNLHSDSYLLFLFKTKSHLKHTSKIKNMLWMKKWPTIPANNPNEISITWESEPNYDEQKNRGNLTSIDTFRSNLPQSSNFGATCASGRSSSSSSSFANLLERFALKSCITT